MAAAPIDESADNEPLEFLESPASSMIGDGERVGQLSKADWSEEKLLEDGEEELDQSPRTKTCVSCARCPLGARP